MSTVAQQLQLAREAQKLTVNQVAEVTKIRTDHLRALEEGNFDIFSAPVYIRGFVRSYATLLKLDVPSVMADLDGELRKTDKFSEPPPLSDQRRGILDFLTLQLSKLNWRIALIVAIVLIVLGVFYFGRAVAHRRNAPNPLANLPPATYQPAQQSGETAPLPSAPAQRR
jgi:cytoskeletal protein RodZ